MATTAPEVLALRPLIAKRVASCFDLIKCLLAEAHLMGDALIVMSDGQPVDVLEWARLMTKIALEEAEK